MFQRSRITGKRRNTTRFLTFVDIRAIGDFGLRKLEGTDRCVLSSRLLFHTCRNGPAISAVPYVNRDRDTTDLQEKTQYHLQYTNRG